MPNQTASELANQIVDDLKGAGFYADPAVLAPLFKSGDVSDSQAGDRITGARNVTSLQEGP